MADTEARILLVDDEPQVLRVLERLVRGLQFSVVACGGGAAALLELRRGHFDVAMIDVRMPDVGGLDVLRVIRQEAPDCQVVLMTGYAAIDTAIEAIKLGALDYMTKPLDFERVTTLLTGVREDAARQRRLRVVEQELATALEFHGMIGRSPQMQAVFGLIRRLAPHVRTALITGETGTGKELAARALHQAGPRRTKRFVTINCSAVVETLFESELFGHVRGAFTGATDNKTGLFEYADGGTLFLDEIGELPLGVQSKLLRVLETGEVQRVGSLESRKTDVHVIAASNRDLGAEVTGGRFRADLYYRLNVVELAMPSLRDRREDIPYLIAVFVRDASARFGKKLVGLTPAAERRLTGLPWNGNIRELRNVVERASMLADGEFITERDLGGLGVPGRPAPGVPQRAVSHETDKVDAVTTVEIDRELLEQLLSEVNGNKTLAANRLGIGRRALYRLIERYHLESAIQRRPTVES
jgi:DNA-binding NtrC family response regulator